MKANGHNGSEDVDRLLREGAVLRALKMGVQRELRISKALGNPIVQNRNGEVVWIPPEEIEVEDPPKDETKNGK